MSKGKKKGQLRTIYSIKIYFKIEERTSDFCLGILNTEIALFPHLQE